MPENTFDIVSKIDLQEVSNAIQQALKEIHTRFDLKDSKSNIELDGKDAIVMHSIDEYKLKAINDILQQKLVKRGVSLKGLTYGAVESSLGGTAKRRITMTQGIPIEKARDIVKTIEMNIVAVTPNIATFATPRCKLRKTPAARERGNNRLLAKLLGSVSLSPMMSELRMVIRPW